MLVVAALVLTSVAVLQRPTAPIETRWAKDVSPTLPHPEYPRPQLVRDRWLCLNGPWDFAVVARTAPRPDTWNEKILVPFPVESALSGVMRRVKPEEAVWYRRTFEIPTGWTGRKRLHFGASDWETTVWINGHELGTHRGGYDPFTYDLSPHLRPGTQELVVRVWDPSDAGTQPRGKQVQNPNGIWYTPTTGLWQSVWLEPVPEHAIDSLRIDATDLAGSVKLLVDGRGLSGLRLEASAAGVKATGPADAALTLGIPSPKLWTPDNPHLYDVAVRLLDGTKVVDEVRSYFGIRKVGLVKDSTGVTRLGLNGKPLFMVGPLDQGFWPDGLYTAPTDEALRYDLEVTKRLGFNTIRKHVKVEPARWYRHCDELGLLVWQDMPSGDKYIGGNDPDVTRTPESSKQYDAELTAVIDALRNHPCIVMWVPFNEGWGQFDTARVVDLCRKLDPSRLVDSASGWTDRGVGDVHDIHAYPGPASPQPEAKRAAVLGEFGGLGLAEKGHMWKGDGWGYRSMDSRAALDDGIVDLMERLRGLIGYPGLSAAIYTQTTDVESEINGLMSYDRAVLKVDEKRVRSAVRALLGPVPSVSVVVPTSQKSALAWRYTFDDPGPGWADAHFSDAGWKSGPGGFGTQGTPGGLIRTEWNTPSIWLRRTVELEGPWGPGAHLLVHHDEDAEVYLDGRLLASLKGYTTGYTLVPAHTGTLFAPGPHTLAVHCRQTQGGQYIDVGLATVK
ncbi:MAG: hypothetical protein M9921_13830 [Fimbriimonadaceae bacterium]|nr:hypothetical protein [Fimbriimonadaceae bacterium]